MIEGIYKIGELVLDNNPDNFIENLVLDVPSEVKGKKQYVVIINFDLTNSVITFDIEEIKQDTAKKYLWVGNASSNNPQDRLTTTGIEYLLSQTLPYLAKNSNISNLEKIIKKFFKEISEEDFRYKYILDITKINNIEQKTISEFNKLYETLLEEISRELKKNEKRKIKNNINKKTKEFIKKISKLVLQYLNSNKNIPKTQIALYTIEINNNLISQDNSYKDYLEKTLIEEIFPESNGRKFHCYICGKIKGLSSNMTKFNFKYYITDKLGFSSNFDKKRFINNFALCKECYKNILSGESFIKNNFKSSIGGLDLYIIPKFLKETNLKISNFKNWSNYIKSSFNSALTFENYNKFIQKIEDYRYFEDQKNNFILNLLFYYSPPGRNEFKILKLIKDIPPLRLDLLMTQANKIKDIADKVLGENNKWFIGFEKIYYLFPIRKDKRNNLYEYKKLLNFYDYIFSGIPINYNFLINEFIKLFCVYRFKKFNNYNIEKTNSSDLEIEMVYSIIETNLLLLYLRNLNLLIGGKDMNETNENQSFKLPSDIESYFKEMNFSTDQRALFLLGYLIGEVGNAQYSSESKNKPILNKIIFQGMSKNKLIRLINEVFEKLKQWKKLQFNESNYAIMKKLFDKTLPNWKLSDQENVYYLLSGYAYNTYKSIESSKKKEGGKNE